MHVHRDPSIQQSGMWIRSRPPSKVLDLKELSCKLAGPCQCRQGLGHPPSRSTTCHILVIFQIAGMNKTRRCGPPREVSYVRFLDCPDTCPVETLRVYEQRTQPLRGDATSLLVACVKPHKPVVTSTISSWIKNMLEQAGIHANAHSTRSAATSAALVAGMSIRNIIDTANWAKESTFKHFYCRPVACSKSFNNTVLQGICSIQAASSLYIML